MKTNQKNKSLTFGEFVADVYHVWGEHKAKGIVKLAVNMRLIEFRGKKWFVIS
jgi:hypothetical protein